MLTNSVAAIRNIGDAQKVLPVCGIPIRGGIRAGFRKPALRSFRVPRLSAVSNILHASAKTRRTRYSWSALRAIEHVNRIFRKDGRDITGVS